MLDSYITLIKGGEGEITEKKSRFIGVAHPVLTEEEAYAFIEGIRKKHYGARHNCFAFSVGEDNPLLRFSDDGEPQGTAGKPILEVISGSGIHNICIVITRYFGGILLGTGGLVRAYTDAARAAVAASETKLMQRIFPVEIKTNYTDMGKLQYILNESGINICDTVFEDNVIFKAEIPVGKKDEIVNKITEATSARAVITLGDEIFG
ncbi:MAG: YigZ family protein [Clostridium sp.]|nr:YigZ family protein [Clostridium sp.]MCM1207284.1 YigZ family protein [Ruminococcus sp.]